MESRSSSNCIPLVTVIIPTCNRANFITDALKSVFAQTYKNLEIIVVDDGSTDSTREILKSSIEKGEIRYIYQENKGPGAARNAGIKNAKGEFIAFLDSDDMWLPEKLSLQLQIFQTYPDTGLVGGGCYYTDVSGIVLGNPAIPPEITGAKDLEISCLFPGSSSNAIVRSKVLNQVGFFDENLLRCEDWDLWLRLSRVSKIRNVTAPVVKIRVHSTPRPHKNFDIIRSCRERVINKVQGKSQKRKAYASTYFSYFQMHYHQKERLHAFVFILRSFLYYPFKISKYNKRLQPFIEMVLPEFLYRMIRFLYRAPGILSK